MLPQTKDPHRISLAGSVCEVLFGLVFLSWWLDVPHVVYAELSSKGSSSLWLELRSHFYIPYVLIITAGIVLSAVNVARPRWTKTRTLMRVALDGATAIVTALPILLHWNELSQQWAAVQNHPKAGPQVVAEVLNLSIAITLAICALGTGIACIVRLRRMGQLEDLREKKGGDAGQGTKK